MWSEKRRSPYRAGRGRAAVFALATAAALAAAAIIPTVAMAAIPNPLDRGVVPNPPSAITVRPDGSTVYKVENCTGCHSDQYPQQNSNHGVGTRPVATTIDAMSNNPYFGSFPGPFSLANVNWAVGGLAIGQELYLFNGSGTYGGNPYTYPQIGSRQWYMDYPGPSQTNQFGQLDFEANLTPGRPAIDAPNANAFHAWWPWTGLTNGNFFTGTSSPTLTASDWGCSSCHAYNASITVTSTPAYALDEWGVTCANCHAQTVPLGASDGARIGAAHAGPYYDSKVCMMCHDRTPSGARVGETTGRAQQIAMGVWDTGQARDMYNEGYEVDKPRAVVPTPTPGATETSSGAGHPDSWQLVIDRFGGSVPENGRYCARCHAVQGWIAHSTNGTDIPYYWNAPTALGQVKQFDVNLGTANGASCVACHPSHGGQQGLNQWSQRAGNAFDVCADCHRNQNLSMVQATSTDAKIPYTDPVVWHPTREMYMGYGGYGVDNMPPAHLTVPLSDTQTGVMCQYCHMPSAIPSGLTFDPPNSSHLFRIVMPSESKTTASVGWSAYPAGATTTSPSPMPGSALPDDSCTGAMCHAQTDGMRDWLQNVITSRQTIIINKLKQAETLRQGASVVASNTVLYQQARTNQLMVRNDGSYGIHNFYYANALLDWSIGTYQALLATPPIPGVVPVTRWEGADRYETAASISARTFAASSTVNAVIVTGQNYPDALSASALAGSVKGPILLVKTDAIPASTSLELQRLGVKNVWIVGGSGVVSTSVLTQLKALVGGAVTRVAGSDRYATSASVAKVVASREGAGFSRKVFLATGQNYPDALSCSPYAYSQKYPVLLTETGALPAAAAGALSTLGITNVTVAGGTGAVSAAVVDSVEAITGAGSTYRIAGQDRYNTCVVMNDYATFNGWATRAFVGVASGQNYPDALTGGPSVGSRKGVMLLTQADTLPPSAAAWLANAQLPPPQVHAAVLFGGSGAVSDTVWAQVYQILNP